MSEATALAAEGFPVTLNDGRVVHIRYTLRSLLWIEQHHGSLEALMVDSESQGLYTKTLSFIAAGLLHEHDGEGAPLTVDRLGDLIDIPAHGDAMTVANKAWAQAFPTPPAKTPAPKKAKASPGTSGTTSQPLSLAEPIATSG
jgi:hypothetical protein